MENAFYGTTIVSFFLWVGLRVLYILEGPKAAFVAMIAIVAVIVYWLFIRPPNIR